MIFQPMDGDRARWRILYEELFSKAQPGDVITYQEMGDLLGMNIDDLAERRILQTTIRRVSRELAEDRRALEAVHNQGYRIVLPEDHIKLAKGYQARSSRSLQRGRSVIENVDLGGLSPAQVKLVEVMAYAFAAQLSFNKSIDVRQKRLEKAVGALTEKGSKTDDQINDLKARLAELESKVNSD